MKPPKRRRPPEPKNPRWFIVRRGFIQHWVHDIDGERLVSLPLFSNRETCQAFIRDYMADAGRRDGEPKDGYRCAEIGTVQDETLDGLLASAVAGGADEALWIQDVRPNGFSWRRMPLWEDAT